MNHRSSYIAMLLLLLCAAAFAQYLAGGRGRELTPSRTLLSGFPQTFEAWRQVEAQTLTAGEMRELKPDDYLSRTYANDDGSSVFLFIAYYAGQRRRQTFHSPQNCLPGAGWVMGDHRLHRINGENGQINEYLIEKDGRKMVAFYWYHGRGRIEASEYWGRWHTIADSIRLGRTDGALVRVIAPAGRGDGAEEQARQVGLDFTRKLLPMLSSYIPD